VDITGAQKDAEKLDKATFPHIHTTKSKKDKWRGALHFACLFTIPSTIVKDD